MKPKVLFLFQLPEPVHGASLVNLSIKDSEIINEAIDAVYHDISPSGALTDLGRFSIKKAYLSIKILLYSIYSFLVFRPGLVYITLSPHGLAFWKDAMILQVLKLLGGKIVIHLHGKGIEKETSKSKFKLFLYRTIFKNTNVIHLSPMLLSDIKSVLDKKTIPRFVNNGVRDKYPGRPKIGHDETINFLYLSNLIPEKGADTLINAINRLDSRLNGRFKVVFVGGSHTPGLEMALQKKLNFFKDSVEFLGPLYGDEKYQELLKAHIFVLPTRYKNECFPLAILEAMSFEMPILSTYEGAIPDIIDDGTTGALFPAKDENELALKMTEYIDNPALISRQGLQSREKYKLKYTDEIFERSLLTELLDIYYESKH